MTGERVEHAAERPSLAELTAGDLMTREVTTVDPAATVGEAMAKMRTLGVRHLPVVAEGRFAGLVDDRLVALALLAGTDPAAALELPVTTAMTHYVPQIGPDVDLQRIAHLLRTSRYDALVVIDGDEALMGIITMVDVVAAVARDRGSH